MYVPAHFEEPSQDVLHGLIGSHPLGILMTNGASGLDANHIPFDLDRTKGEYGTLYCHVARNNAVWKQVPTWNYIVVHAHGRITVHDDERHVRRNVAKLTHRHEASQPVPWKMGDAPREFTASMVKAIVALEIEIGRLVGKAKLSQNKEQRDIRSAGEALIAQGDEQIGQAMLTAAARKPEQPS